MRKEVRGFFRKAAAGVLTAAMCVTSLSTGGIGTALAAPETPAPADREDKSIVYFVDCGDYTVDTVSEGDQLGTHNSVTDQAYGPDAQTGYKWGVVDSEEELEDKKGEGLTNPGAPDNGGVYTANTWAQEGLPVGQELDKMVTNRYSKNFPEKGYDERYVDYAFELEKGKYEITVGCANPWNVSKFQVVKASMETAAQEVALSEEGFAVPSTGAEVSGVVDVTSDTDKVTVDVRGSGGETLCVNVSYIMIQSIKEEETEDEAKVRKDKMSLTLPEEVSEDIKLPSSGENGSKIEWSSSNTDVISNDGKVTRPAAGKEDVSVKLTATITSGDAKDTKEFEVKVLAEPAPVEKAPADREDKDVIYFVDCGDYTVDTVSAGDQLGTHNSVTEQVYGPDAKTGYKWGIVDTKEELPGNPQNGTLPKNGGVYTANTWANEQVDGTNAAKDVTNRYTKNFWEKGIEERFLDYAFEIENGTYDVTVCCVDPWSCSQSPNVYLNYGKDTQATLKEGMEASSKKPATATYEVKDGELTVNFRATGDNNKAINVAYILIRNHREMSEEEKKAEEERRLKSDYASLILNETEICGDIELVKEGANGSTIEWSSSNGAVISTDGKVTRPKTGEDDVFVTLTAKVTYGDSSMEKKFVLKVLAESAATDLQEFTLADVTMEDEYYTNATQKDVDFLNTFDPDRLLYNFRLTAGYTADEIKSGMFDFNNDGDFATKPYNGWENSLISGHTLGHYLAAVAQAVADGYGDEVGGDKRTLKDRLEYLIDSLKDCQDKMGTGYIFGANMENPSKPELQFDILEGKATGGTWVPWYTMHKIVNGLVSTYEYTGNETALEVAENLAEWIYERTSKWDASTNQRVLWTEYGGMNDCLYELYKCARDNGYANLDHIEQAAHKFDEDSLFEAVLSGKENVLNGRHANCTIPKFVGALNRYRALKGEKDVDKYLQYAEAFWTLVVNHHSYITGGNSECEFFGMDDVLDLERSHCNNETCNTHNMLKMTRELYRITGDKKYADYYETNFTNAIMASINEETGMTTYFQPMATGYFKVYGNADLEKNWFWCCTGTGLENFTKLGDAIYFHTADQLVVNQFISSTVTWKDKKVQVKQETDIPVSDTTKFTVSLLDGADERPDGASFESSGLGDGRRDRNGERDGGAGDSKRRLCFHQARLEQQRCS